MNPNLEETVGFLGFPEDIGRLIFELAALLDQETGRSCALVSRKVNAWVEPILYRTIMFEDPEEIQNFCGIINHISLVIHHVKAIAITNGREFDASAILSVLKAYHSIEKLVLWYDPEQSWRLRTSPSEKDKIRDFRDFITSPGLSPRWISIVSDIFPADAVHFSYPIFQNATHVDFTWSEESSAIRWDTFQYLPCSLRVFIVWLYSKSYFSSLPRSEEFAGVKAIQDGDIDSRAVVGYMGDFLPGQGDLHPIIRSRWDVVKDCAGIPVGKDFGTLAEELIEERLRIYI